MTKVTQAGSGSKVPLQKGLTNGLQANASQSLDDVAPNCTNRYDSGTLGFAHLHTLAIWANDEGPSARCNRHANGIMSDVMRVRLALFMECVMGCWHLHLSTIETQEGGPMQQNEMSTYCQIIAECQPMYMQPYRDMQQQSLSTLRQYVIGKLYSCPACMHWNNATGSKVATFARPLSELALGMVAWEKDLMYWRSGIVGAAGLACEQT